MLPCTDQAPEHSLHRLRQSVSEIDVHLFLNGVTHVLALQLQQATSRRLDGTLEFTQVDGLDALPPSLRLSQYGLWIRAPWTLHCTRPLASALQSQSRVGMDKWMQNKMHAA